MASKSYAFAGGPVNAPTPDLQLRNPAFDLVDHHLGGRSGEDVIAVGNFKKFLWLVSLCENFPRITDGNHVVFRSMHQQPGDFDLWRFSRHGVDSLQVIHVSL